MKLFKAEVRTKKKRHALEVIVHAGSIEAARSYLAGKFPGCEIKEWIELDDEPKYFTVAELEDEPPRFIESDEEQEPFMFSLHPHKQLRDLEQIKERFDQHRIFEAGELARFGYDGAAYVVEILRCEDADGPAIRVTVKPA